MPLTCQEYIYHLQKVMIKVLEVNGEPLGFLFLLQIFGKYMYLQEYIIDTSVVYNTLI